MNHLDPEAGFRFAVPGAAASPQIPIARFLPEPNRTTRIRTAQTKFSAAIREYTKEGYHGLAVALLLSVAPTAPPQWRTDDDIATSFKKVLASRARLIDFATMFARDSKLREHVENAVDQGRPARVYEERQVGAQVERWTVTTRVTSPLALKVETKP